MVAGAGGTPGLLYRGGPRWAALLDIQVGALYRHAAGTLVFTRIFRMSYVELQVTSNFSFRRGGSRPEELVDQAADLGYDAIGITDRNTFAGVVRAYQVAKDRNIRLIPGVRLDLLDGPSLLAYPTDKESYARLSALLTLGNLCAEKEKCYISKRDVYQHTEGSYFIIIPPEKITQDFEFELVFQHHIKDYTQNLPNLYLAATRYY